MRNTIFGLFFFVLHVTANPPFAVGQTISESVPAKVEKSQKYLFYLHGGIVQDLGANAVSEDFGKYEYLEILEAFKEHGFHVISEVRPKGTEITAYAEVLYEQVKLLRKRGAKDENIVVVGASLGAYMTLEAAEKLKRSKIKYVLIGLCSEYAVNRYAKYKGELRGNYLSIYEQSDQKQTCQSIFDPLNSNARFKEVKTNTGKGHGFLFRPYKDWLSPIIEWK